jgi:predicted amino acid dehydrogenase
VARFAFVVHPLSVKDLARKYPVTRFFPDWAVSAVMRYKRPVVVSEVTGIRSQTGATADGVLIGCPLTPGQMTSMRLEKAYDKIVACTELAAREGAELVGLGAFTSVIGDGGVTIARRSPIPVTTGNSYTVATAIQGTIRACEILGIEMPRARLAVVGATGSIGKTCARMLGPSFGETVLVGRDLEKTRAFAADLGFGRATDDLNELRSADAVVTVTSSSVPIIEPGVLKAGAVVCDVARPRDVSVRVAQERPDVLVLEGGVVRVPGPVEFHFNFGFPERTAYACMSETMMLALENRLESYTLGKDVSPEQVTEMMALAEKHGFELAGFRSFERPVSEEAINRARHARLKRQASYA